MKSSAASVSRPSGGENLLIDWFWGEGWLVQPPPMYTHTVHANAQNVLLVVPLLALGLGQHEPAQEASGEGDACVVWFDVYVHV